MTDNTLYKRLKLPRKIDGAVTVGELMDRGCPRCGGRLYPEASICFGHLRCPEHGAIWQWIPTKRERCGYAPTAWKNQITGACSREWIKRWGRERRY